MLYVKKGHGWYEVLNQHDEQVSMRESSPFALATVDLPTGVFEPYLKSILG